MSDTPQNPKKQRLFFTFTPEKKIAGWFLGVSSAKRTAKAFGEFHETMRHGDQKHAYWVAALSQEDRNILARRIYREAAIYIGLGGLLGISSFWEGLAEGTGGNLGAGLFWLCMGLLASVMGLWIATVKLWQAHNVRYARSVSLRDFLSLSGKSEEGGHGG